MLADLPPPTHDPEQARQAADEILSRPEYDWPEEGRSLLERIAEWIAEQLGRLTSSLGAGGGGSLPVWVGWLVLALLVALAGLLLYRTRAGWRRTRTPADQGTRVVVAADDELVDWPAEVARCEAAGLWREALRARYRVLVGELARRELTGDLVGRTAGELVDDVTRTAPATAPAFARATDLFEEAWYGGRRVEPVDRDRFAEVAAAVVASAPASPQGAGARRAVPA